MSLFGVVAFYARQDKSDGGGKHFMLRPGPDPHPGPEYHLGSGHTWAGLGPPLAEETKGLGLRV